MYNPFKRMEKTEYFLTHSMRLALPWYQNQTKTLQENYQSILSMNVDGKSSTKYFQIKSNNV